MQRPVRRVLDLHGARLPLMSNVRQLVLLDPSLGLLLANAVLVVHVGIATFVVVGPLLVLVGNLKHWEWANNAWFRIAHMAAIGIVVASGEIFGGGIAPVIGVAIAQSRGIQNILWMPLVGVAFGAVISLFLRETAPVKVQAVAPAEAR